MLHSIQFFKQLRWVMIGLLCMTFKSLSFLSYSQDDISSILSCDTFLTLWASPSGHHWVFVVVSSLNCFIILKSMDRYSIAFLLALIDVAYQMTSNSTNPFQCNSHLSYDLKFPSKTALFSLGSSSTANQISLSFSSLAFENSTMSSTISPRVI